MSFEPPPGEGTPLRKNRERERAHRRGRRPGREPAGPRSDIHHLLPAAARRIGPDLSPESEA